VKIQIRLTIRGGGHVADLEIEYREVFAYCTPLSPSPSPSPAKG
jgi:hypothetical protein